MELLVLFAIFCLVPPIVAVLFVRRIFRPGLQRKAASAIAAGFCMPTVIFGNDGIPVPVPGVLSVFFPRDEGRWDPHDMLWGLVPMAIGAVMVFSVAVLVPLLLDWIRGRANSTVTSSSSRESTILVWLMAIVSLSIIVEFGYRVYWKEFNATYGPFVVTIDTGKLSLKNMVATISCVDRAAPPRPLFWVRHAMESGVAYELPAAYIGPIKTSGECTVTVWHPQLQADFTNSFSFSRSDARKRIEWTALPLPWREEIAEDLDQELRSLGLKWVPYVCDSDWPNVKHEYLSMVMDRRVEQFRLVSPDPGYIAFWSTEWDRTCDASRAQTLVMSHYSLR